jgi:2-keto-4-pentenoate hydratase
MSTTHESAADIIARCWRDGVKVDGLPQAVRPRTLEEGFLAQAALAPALEDRAVGWKLAATALPGQRHLKVDGPVPGRLFAARVLDDGAHVSMQGNRMLVAECEFVFTLADDLPPRAAPYLREEVMAAVASLHPGLELPDSRFEHFESAGAAQLAADNACAHWMVVGPATRAPWREVDLSTHETCLLINGKVVTRGRGADVLGDPRDALTWLANQHALLGEGLRAGQLITTGVTGQPCPIAAGDRVQADLGVFGKVSATLTD